MADTAAIAKALEAQFSNGTWYEALIPHLADVIEVVHHPDRSPNDGPTPRETLIGLFRRGAGHEGARQTLTRLTVDGDKIRAEQEFSTALNGKTFRFPLAQVFTFRDGLMVALDHYPDTVAVKEFAKAMQESAAAAPAGE